LLDVLIQTTTRIKKGTKFTRPCVPFSRGLGRVLLLLLLLQRNNSRNVLKFYQCDTFINFFPITSFFLIFTIYPLPSLMVQEVRSFVEFQQQAQQLFDFLQDSCQILTGFRKQLSQRLFLSPIRIHHVRNSIS
jgi:hypothetical protein